MVYVHVPYCRSFCTYCDFYSEIADRCVGQYADAVVRETAYRKEEFKDADTLYIGGGTPSVLPLLCLEKIVAAITDACRCRSFTEFTVEVNPDDIVKGGHAYVEALVALGVNRVSMGAQSFDDSVLKWMNRRHSADDAVSAYRILRDSGIGNVSIDLIFGLSQCGEGDWRRTLEKALDIGRDGRLPEHISAYQLSVEQGSVLADMVKSGKYSEADDDVCLDEYTLLCEILRGAGYHHYEISNFALPGFEAMHNSFYWRHRPYIGLGPGAHSFSISGSGEYVRSWNLPDVHKYIEVSGTSLHESMVQREILSGEQVSMERIMLMLRTDEGLDPGDFSRPVSNAVRRLLSSGLLEHTGYGNRIRIPEKHLFISDSIISELAGEL